MSLPTRAPGISLTMRLQVFSGTHYDMGIQQGKVNRELLHRILEQAPKLEAVKDMKPRMLPTALFLSIAKRRAIQLLENDIAEYYPEQAKRLRGISEGAGTGIGWAYFTQAMEFLPSFGPSNYKLKHAPPWDSPLIEARPMRQSSRRTSTILTSLPPSN